MDTHTFTNLTLNTEYQVRTQVKDALGNGYAVSGAKAITTVNITKPTITLSTTAPTNKSITATITYPNITGITKQYSYDNKTWSTYTTALTIDTNKTIYARSIDSTNQGSDSTRVASLTVTNIDKTQPTVAFGTNGSTSYKKSQSTTVTVTNAGTSTVNASSLKYQWTQSTTAPAESTFSSNIRLRRNNNKIRRNRKQLVFMDISKKYSRKHNNSKIKCILFRQHSTKHNSANSNKYNKLNSSNISTNRLTQWNKCKYKTILNKENIRQ